MSIWDERYAYEKYAFGTAPNDFLAEVAPQLAAGDTLSLGEGEGRNAVFLAELGHNVTGVDASKVGLAKAQDLARARNVQIKTEVVDLNDYDMGAGQWDTITAIFVHLPPSLRRTVFDSVVRALRPNGVFVAEYYTPAQLQHGTGGPSTPEMLVSAQTVRDELHGLDYEILHEVTREIQEGPFHNGTSATVQILARKR